MPLAARCYETAWPCSACLDRFRRLWNQRREVLTIHGYLRKSDDSTQFVPPSVEQRQGLKR